ncbi:urease accessory protein UreE [Bermanella marisrubri]|uniref:Urease accessory protein UreE n=1 Tax=Bermanella marisrubri TaxID=207949 RepID=Q1MZ28_9GAMM|nr:urease accessory protein UreE [Bermanella marisrubri]EAT11200.1 urease accessory protein UreE [Oceanobacter sp. RED65] [Bermanella marisrubri]QIZ85662.1 urease accessory protein UreE [Bermanella marisrubri]
MKIFTQLVEGDLPQGKSSETISLSFDDRKRGRLKIKTDSGIDAGIQIERGHVLRHGAVLSNEHHEYLTVLASDEKVSTAKVEDKTLFARCCYHLGNRHVPLQIGEGFLRYQEDYVLDDMLHGLGVHVIHEQAPFEPENGAYSKGGHHHHHEH